MARINRKKIEVDAAGQAPGRVATKIAMILMGKTKASYETHVDHGDKVVVINAEQAVFTGKKMDQKVYRHHSMHPGGLKEAPAKRVIKEDPTEVIRHAVAKMLPKNKLRTDRLKRLTFKK